MSVLGFKTSAQRREDEMRRLQGLPPTSNTLGFSNVAKSLPSTTSTPTLNSTPIVPPGYEVTGTNTDGTPIVTPRQDGVSSLPQPSTGQQAVGGATTAASLLGYGPEAAAAAAAIYGTANGLGAAKNQFAQGGQQKQTGINRGINAIASPVTGFIKPNDTITNVGSALMGNPLGIASTLGVNFFSGKSKDQVRRDQVRELLTQKGFLGADANGKGEGYLTLADGSKFSIGQDGGARLTDSKGQELRPYNTDTNNPLTAEAVPLVQPLVQIMIAQSGQAGNQASRDQFTAYLTNAVLSNATDEASLRKNVSAVYKNYGLKPDEVRAGIDQLLQAKIIDQQTRDVYQAKMNEISSPSKYGQADHTGATSISFPNFPSFKAAPAPKPQVDLSLLQQPVNPLQQAQDRYNQTKTQSPFGL